MRCFSLFSGIGGFDLAAKRQGYQIVGACEIDKHARSVYKQHFPDVPVWEDATKIKPEELPDFEMLCAGFPCQAFSLAGKRLGFEDTRGTLFYEIARIAREKRPRYLFLENVKGLLYHDEGRTLTTIIKVFYELGYDIEWQVINGKYFLPQNRERIFIIGHLRGQTPGKIFPIGESNKIDTDSRYEPSEERKWVSGTIDSNYHKGGSRTMILDNPSESQYKRIYNTQGISPCLGVGHTMNSSNVTIPVLTPDRPNRSQNGRRFKTNGEPSFTLTTQDRHGIYDGCKIRKLTPIECERLQGFPDGWTKNLSDTQRYKCLGNAVMVPCVEEIFKTIKDVENA